MSDPNANVKKRQLLLVGGAVAGILMLALGGMFLFDSGPATKREKPKTVTITSPGTVDDKDAWRAQQGAKEKANEQLITEVRTQLKAQEEQTKKLEKALLDLKAEKSGPSRMDTSILDRPLPLTTNSPTTSPVNKGAPNTLNQPLNKEATPPPARKEVEIFRFNEGTENVPGAAVPEDSKKASNDPQANGGKELTFLPAGSFVRATMLNGVDAPTGGQAQSNPLPVAFHVLDVANLANKHRLDIKDCRIVAATWGDLSSERMMGRTESLTCIINGETVEMQIKGQVIGEDGKAGVRGRLVTKQGQLLANALFAGALGGIGKAIQSAGTVTTTGAAGAVQTIDAEKIKQVALGGGLASASDELAKYYLKAADKLFPVIETDGGRIVEILITQGAIYKGNNFGKGEYRGLLKRSTNNSRGKQDD